MLALLAGCGAGNTGQPTQTRALHGATDQAPSLSPLERSIASVDDALSLQWTTAKVEVAAEAVPTAYMRRASLDLIGRIPSAGEVLNFGNHLVVQGEELADF